MSAPLLTGQWFTPADDEARDVAFWEARDLEYEYGEARDRALERSDIPSVAYAKSH